MRRRPLAILAAALLVLAGCGGGGSSSETTAQTTVFTGPLAAPNGHSILNVPITISESMVSPQYTRLTIPGIYTIDVTNEGRGPHALVVERDGVRVRTAPIPPGKSADLKVDLSVPGTYEVYCPIDGHRAKGEHAVITMGED